MIVVAGATIAFNWSIMYNIGLTNIGTVSTGIVKYLSCRSKLPKTMTKKIRKFIQVSSVVTFVHHFFMICLILLFISTQAHNCVLPYSITKFWAKVVIYPDPNLVNQDMFSNDRDSRVLFAMIINNIIGAGIINLIMILYESRDIEVILDHKNNTQEEERSDFRNSLEYDLTNTNTQSNRRLDSFNSTD